MFAYKMRVVDLFRFPDILAFPKGAVLEEMKICSESRGDCCTLSHAYTTEMCRTVWFFLYEDINVNLFFGVVITRITDTQLSTCHLYD